MKKQDLLRIAALAAIIALGASVTPRTAVASSTVYVAGSGNEFGTLNLTTGAFTSIGTLNLPSGDQIFGMGFGADGNLYGVDNESDAQLFRINPTNATVTDLGAIGMSAIDATMDASGKMFVLSHDANAIFYTLNPPSTATNVVGPTGISSEGLFAVNAAGTQLFTSVVTGGSTYDLASVNLTTGVATDIGNTGFFPFNGLFVGSTLYGFDAFGKIITLNTTTGAGTQVGTYSLPNGDLIGASAVLMSQSVPEPSGLVLGLVSVVLMGSLGLIRRRRHSARAGPRVD